nr:MAG: hypothetical protein [Penaeus semisulcatus pemonivirus]
MSVTRSAPTVKVKPVGEGATLCFGEPQPLPTVYSGIPMTQTLAVNVFQATMIPPPSKDSVQTPLPVKEIFIYRLSDECERLMRPYRKFMLDVGSKGNMWDFILLV